MTEPRNDPTRCSPAGAIALSVITPAHNECENISRLVEQLGAALSPLGIAYEVIVIDDCSTDATRSELQGLMPQRAWLRCVAMRFPASAGKGAGQSAAFEAAVRAARGELIAMLDADLQNDPADLPMMLRVLSEQNADLVQGDRSHARQDHAIRRVGSAVGRYARRLILGDRVRDTGCSLRVIRREWALRLPLQFRGIHRFIPALVAGFGGKVVEVRVNHRARTAGTTKYGMGIVQRAIPGLLDCLAVRWMLRRWRRTEAFEVATVTPPRTPRAVPAETPA